jgi:MmeI, N-terminal domain
LNAVEIEEAISALADQPFDRENFPYAFLEAFGNKATTIKRLQSGSTNSSGLDGGVLQRNNIHIAVCDKGQVTKTLAAIKASPATAKAKYVLATDGVDLEAEDLISGETIACLYPDFPNHFGFFLSLAGITTVKQIRDSSSDIMATGRINRLYVELLKDNPEWGTAERRHDMNHFTRTKLLATCYKTPCFTVPNESVAKVRTSRTAITGIRMAIRVLRGLC